MSIAPDEGNLLYFSGHGKDILVGNLENEEDSHLITCDQSRLFISYSHALCNKAPHARPPSPLDYEFFAHTFNSEGLTSTASYIDENGLVVSTGAALDISDIIGDDDDMELTLSTTHMAQVEKMVWHTTLSASHQRERMEARCAGQRKEKNFGQKQEQKLHKKGLGKIRKGGDLKLANTLAGPSIPTTSAEETMLM